VQKGIVVSSQVSRLVRALSPWPALLLAAVFFLNSAAPAVAGRPIEFKRIVGFSWGRFSEPPSPVGIPEAGFSLGNQTGLLFAGGGVLPLSRFFSLDLNVQYLNKGTKVHHTFMGEITGTSTYNFRALSVPLSLRFGLLRGSTPYVLAGFETAYFFNHEVAFFPAGSDAGTVVKLAHVVRHFDFAALLGGGFELRFKKWVLFAEMRWYNGLINLSQGVEGYPVIKTRTLSLQIGFRNNRSLFPF